MVYEEAFKFIQDIASTFLNEADAIAKCQTSDKRSDVYDSSHPLFAIMDFSYANLFIKEWRDKFDSIYDNTTRSQEVKRIREKCLLIESVIGPNHLDTLIANQIDAIWRNNTSRPRALRRELETYFKEHPTLWFCIVASSAYCNLVVAKALKRTSVKPKHQLAVASLGTGQKTHTAAAAS